MQNRYNGKAQSVQNRLNGKSTVSAEQIQWEKHSQCRMDSMEKVQSVQNGFNGKSTVSAEWIQWKKYSQTCSHLTASDFQYLMETPGATASALSHCNNNNKK